MTAERSAQYVEQLNRLTTIAMRYDKATSAGERKLLATADWVVRQWDAEARKLLQSKKNE
jgi:hypothetical protein